MPKKPKQEKKMPSPSLKTRKIKIKVVGIGGGGASIVSEMTSSLKGVSFLVADTDEKVLKKVKKGVRALQFGEKTANGMGTGMNPELAQAAAIEEKEKISRAIGEQDLIVLIGSLGGGVASGAGPVVASAYTEQKNISIGIFTLPFSFEGEKKMKIAKKALVDLQDSLSGVIVVPNEKILELVDKKTPLKKSLSALNQVFVGWLCDLIGVISKPGLINIDFADLKTILAGKGKVLFFGEGVAHGPNRAEEAVKNIFQNPFTEGEPKRVKKMLFNVTGGKDLGLKEVETVSNQIAKLNPKAKIIFGISEDTAYNGRIKVTLLCVSDTEKSEKSEKKVVQKNEKKFKKIKLGLSKKQSQKPAKENKVEEKREESREEEPEDDKKPRRNALEVKEDEKEEKDREWGNEPDWDVPAFLRDKG